MTLEDIVYQIDGKLEISFSPDKKECCAVIRDNTGAPALVYLISERRQMEARAKGATPEEARKNLVGMLRGNILEHQWNQVWINAQALLRIPESLITGMTNRERWIKIYGEEAGSRSEHPYDRRFLMICRDIVKKIEEDPAYEPPTFEEVMKDSPWGP